MKPRRIAGKPDKVDIKVLRLDHGYGLPLPAYQSAGAAGLDLHAAVAAAEPLLLEPLERALVPTGLALQIPPGFEAQVRPRSGLAWAHGITVLNSPGTIDSDYRGEVQVLLINLSNRAVKIARGERIAQLVVAPVARAVLNETPVLNASRRGAGGFGSTGRTAQPTRSRPAAAPRARQASKSGDKAMALKAGAKSRQSKTGNSSGKPVAKKVAIKRAAKPVSKKAPRAAAKSAAKASSRRKPNDKTPVGRAAARRQKVKSG